MQFEASLDIAPDHPAFAGHFPGTPIVPGVVLLDAVVHAVMRMRCGLAAGPEGAMVESCQIVTAKFLSPVGPGEALTISLNTAASGNIRFDITGGNRKIATGSLAMSVIS